MFGVTTQVDMLIINSTFGVATGILVAHSSEDIRVTQSSVAQIIAQNVSLASTNPVVFDTSTPNFPDSYVRVEKLGQTAGQHKTWFNFGTVSTDSVIFNTAAPSERLTPSNASNKMQGGSVIVAVASGDSVTAAVYTRKSSSGDPSGANYNGNQQRLICKTNAAMGVNADTVVATASAGTGAWEQISGSIATSGDDGSLEFYVDCDGTAGWINNDDWSFS
jgi:hypothetical protein